MAFSVNTMDESKMRRAFDLFDKDGDGKISQDELSDVLNKRELLRNTFLREFVPVEGMAELYRHWGEEHEAVFHYVSASPWQLQPELEGFLRNSGFPPATFHLKSVRLNALPGSGDSLLNLLEKGASFKPRHIEVCTLLYLIMTCQCA